MQSPRGNKKLNSPNSKTEKSPQTSERANSPRSNKLNGFKPKTLSDLKPIQSRDKSSKSPISKHERSLSSLYSKHMQHKCYEDFHELGYSAEQITDAVDFIFRKYDANKDGLLDRKEVKTLIESSLLHMGSNHNPSELEIIQFIFSIDKNNDGQLSKLELINAFKRANRIEY